MTLSRITAPRDDRQRLTRHTFAAESKTPPIASQELGPDTRLGRLGRLGRLAELTPLASLGLLGLLGRLGLLGLLGALGSLASLGSLAAEASLAPEACAIDIVVKAGTA